MSDETRPSWQTRDEDEEDEEEVDENAYVSQKDAVLFAIEISESMMTVPPAPKNGKAADTDSPASAALKCAYRIMQDRIISNPRDMMGILLFGTKKTKFQDHEETSRGGLQYPHCYLVADLDIPDAPTVKLIKRLTENNHEKETEALLTPSHEGVSMADLLFCANQAFTTKAPNFGSRRLFIVTDNDNPHADDQALRQTTRVRAKDLYDLGVIIELFPISKPNHEFDRTAFYDDILYADPNSDAISVASAAVNPKTDGMTLLTSLISNVKSKQVPKRSYFSGLEFEIGPKLKISVKGYNVIQKQKPTSSCWIWEDGEKFQIAQRVTKLISDDGGTEVARDVKDKKIIGLKKAFKFAGSQVPVLLKEYEYLKEFREPSEPWATYKLPDGEKKPRPKDSPKDGKILRIIGFKPEKLLPAWATIKKSTFIYPSEDDFVGSTRVFAALHQKLLKDKLMGLAWCIPRKNSAPTIVAILPSVELLSKHGQQICPAGLWLCTLPFVDDLRPLPSLLPPIVANDTLTGHMRLALKQLQLPNAQFDPTSYPNPALQWHYSIVQAMALEEELPEIPDDKLVPRYRQIDKRAASHLADWNTELSNLVSEHRRNAPEAKKRSSADDDAGAPKKKVKKEKSDDVVELSKDDMKELVQQNKVAKCTVKQLKEFLKNQGLVDTGLKPALVERVEEFFE